MLFAIVALIMSAVVHEYAHGWMAFRLGDSTAKDAGRLTLNPLKHLDWFGSVLLPLILVWSKSPFFIAWAKPVPYNPYNLRDAKYGGLKVAVAGPAANLLLAIIFGLLARLLAIAPQMKLSLALNFFQSQQTELLSQMSGSFLNSLFVMSIILVFINLALMIFNLIPVPPLDGSKIIYPFLPVPLKELFHRLEPWGLFILIILIAFNLFNFIVPLILRLFSWLTGV